MAIEKITALPTYIPQERSKVGEQQKIQNSPAGCYKETRDRALSIIGQSHQNCLDMATRYHLDAYSCRNEFQEAAKVEGDQMINKGTVIAAVSIVLSFLGITGAVINPQGINKGLLETVKTVCDTGSRALNPSVTGISSIGDGLQEPTKTRHTLAQNDTHKNTTLEQTMDQEVKTIQSAGQHIIDSSASHN
jgi:hypothetical protein